MEAKDVLTELKAFMEETLAKQAADNVEAVVEVPGPMAPLTSFGSICLWTGFACMAGSSCYFLSSAMNRSAKQRNIEMITFFITAIATLAYLSMASGYGVLDNHTQQPFFYARYLDWLFTTPLMVWDVLALAGAPSDDILQCVFIDILMIAFGCVGAQTPEGQKWYFFIIGMLCYVHVVQTLLKYNKSQKYGEAAQKLYNKVASMTIVLWSLYPLVWVVAEGTRMISPSLEACCYMIMDVLSKCLFGFFIVGGREALDNINQA